MSTEKEIHRPRPDRPRQWPRAISRSLEKLLHDESAFTRTPPGVMDTSELAAVDEVRARRADVQGG